MSKVPGDSLFNLYYWALPEEERQDIMEKFLKALQCVFLDSSDSLPD